MVIDGRALTDPNAYYAWSDGHIACDIDELVPIVVNCVYKFAIGEIVQSKNDPVTPAIHSTPVIISPEFLFRYLIKWVPNSPSQSGHAGDVIQEIACGILPPQGVKS